MHGFRSHSLAQQTEFSELQPYRLLIICLICLSIFLLCQSLLRMVTGQIVELIVHVRPCSIRLERGG